MKHLLFVLLIALCLVAPSPSRGDQTATDGKRATAEGLVKKAVAYYRTNGAEKLIEEASNLKGQFVQGPIYVYVLAADGVMLAHPANANLLGQNTMKVRDADGRSITQLTFDAGDGKTSPWIEYQFKNPQSNEVEPKVAYVEKVDDMYLVCGFYKKR
jgi:cytochrome c